MPRLDPHSYCDSDQPETAFFDWQVRVDFERRQLAGQVVLTFAASAARQRGGVLDLDTRSLQIEAIEAAGQPLPYELGAEDPVLGSRLRITLPPDTPSVLIRYRTGEQATALGWLAPEQTAGKRLPYLFSQCQAIHARSIVPLQDTPRRRVVFTARLNVPSELRSLMGARFVERRMAEPGRAEDHWQMPEPIPPYLLALAVGDVVSRELSPRVRVWAEPSEVDAAAREFDAVEAMITAAERLFGPYDWERFDLLVMPPSFPYGGMENPRLTFLTPTVVVGDRSLVSVVAHELSHSWTGNLVSNASAEHFWLNEGFTVYAERRIIEALHGREESELHAAVGRKELLDAIEELAAEPELTRLRGQLDGVDPDHAFSIVPYEKGYLLLRAIEENEGRARWDVFMRRYMAEYRFQALTTEEWLAFLERELPGAAARAEAARYLHHEGLPESAPRPRSERLDRILVLPPAAPDAEEGGRLSPLEWMLYLDHMPRPTPLAALAELDERFALTRTRNADILCSWLSLGLESGYPPASARALEFLGAVGRMKYLKPLYRLLLENETTAADAREAFARYRDGYHPIARNVIEALMQVSFEPA